MLCYTKTSEDIVADHATETEVWYILPKMESPPYGVTIVSSLKRENCSAEPTREVYMTNSEGEREAIPPQQDQDQPIRLLGQYIIPSGRLEKMCTLLHTTADQLLAGLRKRPSTDKVA